MEDFDWNVWFKTRCPKIPQAFRELFSANLIENQVIDLESLKDILEIDPTFLKVTVGVKNAAFELSIKKHLDSDLTIVTPSNSMKIVDEVPETLQSALSAENSLAHATSVGVVPESRVLSIDAYNSPLQELEIKSEKSQLSEEFKPSVNVGTDENPILIAVHNVSLFRSTSDTRAIYFGQYTIAKKTHEVVIKKESNCKINEMEHEALILTELGKKGNKSCVELLYYHSILPYYVIMEKFGENMSVYLQRDSSIKVQLLEGLVLSVKSLHSDGFVHCDLKPDNVLVEIRGGVVRVKLCDLDSARRVNELVPYDEETGALKYTYEWVSPEVYFGKGGLTQAKFGVDIFALGLIAAVLFDDEVTENKTILPRRTDGPDLLELFLSNQSVLYDHMQCHCNSRYREAIHSMCILDPSNRHSLHEVMAALELNRATAYQKRAEKAEEQNVLMDLQNNFLRTEVVEKLVKIDAKLDDVMDQLKTMGNNIREVLKQNEELRNLVDTVISGAHDCPTLFVFVPEVAVKWTSKLNPLRFVQDKYRLFFMCSHTKQLVKCGPEDNGYPVTVNKAWVKKAAPYLKLGLVLLKEVVSTFHVPLPIGPVLNLLSDDFELHSKFIDSSLKFLDDAMDMSTAVTGAQTYINVATDGIVSTEEEISGINAGNVDSKHAYENVKMILQKDNYWASVQATCGLEQVRYKGHVAWIQGSEEVKRKYMAACDKDAMKRNRALTLQSVASTENMTNDSSAGVSPVAPPPSDDTATAITFGTASIVAATLSSPADPPADSRLHSVSVDSNVRSTSNSVDITSSSTPTTPSITRKPERLSSVHNDHATSAQFRHVDHANTLPNHTAAHPSLHHSASDSTAVRPQSEKVPVVSHLNPVYHRDHSSSPVQRPFSMPIAVATRIDDVPQSVQCYPAEKDGNIVYLHSAPQLVPNALHPRYRGPCWACCLRQNPSDPGCHARRLGGGLFSKETYEHYHPGTFRTDPCIISDRDILMAFFHTTDGPKWTKSTNWGTTMPLSTWYGIKTHPEDPEKVIEIVFRDNHIKGFLLDEFSLMTDLAVLRIDGSNAAGIIGELPASYASLVNMRKISLKNNRLAGRMPESWRALRLVDANMHSLNPQFAQNIKYDFMCYQPKCKMKQ